MTSVLVVDDASLTRRILTGLLKKNQVTTVLEAADGLEAFERLEEVDYQVDLIVTDWRMPRMDGLEFIAKLRGQERGRDIPVIVVSSESDDDRVQRALELGANSYIRKPFNKEILRRRLRSVGNLRQVSASGTTDTTIRGHFSLFALPELVHFLHFVKRTGRLEITTGNGPAHLIFLNGEVIDARYDGKTGVEAFFALVRGALAEFRFFDDDSDQPRRIEGSTIALLMEAMRILDEEATRPPCPAGQ